MKKNDDLLKKLADQRKRAVNDDPHGEKKTAAKTKSKPTPPRRILTDKKAEQERGRARTGVTLSPSGMNALREIELFLINECGERRMNASSAMDVALQLAAGELTGKKARIQEITTGLAESDGRRRSA